MPERELGIRCGRIFTRGGKSRIVATLVASVTLSALLFTGCTKQKGTWYTKQAGASPTVVFEVRAEVHGRGAAMTEYADPSTTGATIRLRDEVFLTNADIARTTVLVNSHGRFGPEPEVHVQLTAEGTKKFKDITARNLKRRLALFLDEKLVTAPIVKTVISDGRFFIEAGFKTTAEAERVAKGLMGQ